MDKKIDKKYKIYRMNHTWCWTHREVEFFCDIEQNSIYIQKLAQDIKNLIDCFDQDYSRFRPDSLLNQYNRWEISIWGDQDLKRMIELWYDYQTLTDWVFCIDIARDLVNLWYGKDIYTTENQKYIDLWGLWKGFLIDKISTYIQTYEIQSYNINAGGDIYIYQSEQLELWPLYIQHPTNIQQYIWKIQIAKGGFANSGTQYRSRWAENEFHHLIDNKTHSPSTHPYLSVHILHSSIIVADIAATTLFVTPLEKFEHIATILDVERLLVLDDMSTLMSPWFPLQNIDS